MEKKINIGKNAKVSIIVNTNTTVTDEEERNIKALFAKKYGIPESNISISKCPIKTEGETTDDTLNSDNVKDIYDNNFRYSLYKSYMGENNIEDVDFDKIVEIDSQICSLVDTDSYEKAKRYTIKWVDWSNFLSYGKENHFDFTDLHGLVLLNGVPGNKSGKSTFAYDLLHFLLFGETKSGKVEDTQGELFNTYLPSETEMKVEGCINIDGIDYIIRRTLTRPAKSKKEVRVATQKVEYFRLLENGEREELVDCENLQEESTAKTNKVIKESIGNEKDFDLVISANSKDLDELITLKKDAKGKLLQRWIGLSILEDMDAIARQKWNKEISVGRYCDLYNRETLKTEIDALEEENNSLRTKILDNKKKIADAEKDIQHQNELKDEKIKSKKPVDESVTKLGDVNSLEYEKKNLETGLKEKEGTLTALKDEFDKFGEIEYSDDEYKALQKEKEEIIEKQATLRSKYESLKKNNEDLASAEYCPMCKRKFDNVDNSGLINENKEKMKQCIAEGNELKARKEEIIPLMEKIDEKREEQKKKNKVELRIAAINTEIVSMKSRIETINNGIAQINKNKEAIKFNDEVDAAISVINENIKVYDRIRISASNENVSYIETGKHNKETIGTKKGYIQKIEEEMEVEKVWKVYLKMIGKDGISKMVLRKALPIINNELERLLYDVADFKVEVTMNDKNDVNFFLIRDGVKTRLSAASGLERTEASLALRFVLGNMSRLSRPPFVVLDEILGTVNKENYEDVKKLYDKIVKNYAFILHICHLPEWYDYHNQVVTIQKVNNISSVKSIENV